MDREETVYRKLQKHLDRQPIGFPTTFSKVELRVLKHLFTEEEAGVMLLLNFRPQSLEMLFKRACSQALYGMLSIEKLEGLLDGIQKKGGLETVKENGRTLYCTSPLVVGMYEMQVGRLSQEFIRDFKAYTRTPAFGLSLLSTRLPQMRVIPIEKSIRPQNVVSSFDQLREIIEKHPGPFAVLECICRKKKAMEGTPCRATEREETCLGMGDVVETVVKSAGGREITRLEVLDILNENQRQGLVLQPSNTRNVDFICSCCGCCCGMLGIHKCLPKPDDFWATNFQARIDVSACTGCGICEKRCHVDAVSVRVKRRPALVDPTRCLGCGVCIPTCPEKAISLVKKTRETIPPKTRHDLHEAIMEGKTSSMEKAVLTGKLIRDAVMAVKKKRIR